MKATLMGVHMGAFGAAIEREQWELAAYYLLVSAARLAGQVPRETLVEMLGLLAEGEHEPAE